jgi:tetratricopeptide (TPR) repeat protein
VGVKARAAGGQRKKSCRNRPALPRLAGNSGAARYTEGVVTRAPLAATLALVLAGCAPARQKPAENPGRAASRPAGPDRTEVPRTIVTPTEATDVQELFRRAQRLLDQGDAAGAARAFDRLVQLDPDGPLAPESLYRGAESHEQAGDRVTSLARFEQLARRFPKHALGREALVRSIRLLCFLEQWKRAGEASDQLMARYSDLGPFESIVALSGKALWLVAAGDAEGATYYVEKARNVVDAHRLDAAGRVPRDLAQLYFALGEARRIKAERIHFVPVPPNFAAVLEERCQLLLDAQSAYSDTMRAYDAHWSAMAGFRVGELYEKLHEDLMAIPKPKGADTDARKQLFEGAMRLRYAILLDKALAMMEHTLSMATHAGEHSAWVDKARDAKQKIERARAAEAAAIDRLPYTREQLQAALDDLAKKTADKEAAKAHP